MITMSELLEDKVFREFMLTAPKTPKVARHESLAPMWWVYVQKTADSRWRRKGFKKYKKAYKFMKLALESGYHDASITNRRIDFDPPKRWVRIKNKFVVGSDGVRRQAKKQVDWRPKLPPDETEHHWCRFCRRPTVFKHYSKHHALPSFGNSLSWDVRRCCICGGSERIAMSFKERFTR